MYLILLIQFYVIFFYYKIKFTFSGSYDNTNMENIKTLVLAVSYCICLSSQKKLALLPKWTKSGFTLLGDLKCGCWVIDFCDAEQLL